MVGRPFNEEVVGIASGLVVSGAINQQNKVPALIMIGLGESDVDVIFALVHRDGAVIYLI